MHVVVKAAVVVFLAGASCEGGDASECCLDASMRDSTPDATWVYELVIATSNGPGRQVFLDDASPEPLPEPYPPSGFRLVFDSHAEALSQAPFALRVLRDTEPDLSFDVYPLWCNWLGCSPGLGCRWGHRLNAEWISIYFTETEVLVSSLYCKGDGGVFSGAF